MNKILVEVSAGELLDKISILEIKKEKITDSEKLKFINDELNVLKAAADENIKINAKTNSLFKSSLGIIIRRGLVFNVMESSDPVL